MAAVIQRFNALFALWVVLVSGAAYLTPDAFTWFARYIKVGLMIIMLAMGMTLVPDDFTRVRGQVRAVGIGVLGQFGLMPIGAFAVTKILGLPDELALGVLLVCSCPGGTASNVIAYLAKADVALSVTMTAVSTVLSPLLTPLLLRIWGGALVEVSPASQMVTIAQIVLVPVLGGLILRYLLDRFTSKSLVDSLLGIFPSISILFIVLIVGCIVGLNASRLGEFGAATIAAVMLTNAFGLGSGYGLALLAGCDRRAARTIAIEVGMQNSGLGVALANQFFSPLTALPSAFFSLWHNITGPVLASTWAAKSQGNADPAPPAL